MKLAEDIFFIVVFVAVGVAGMLRHPEGAWLLVSGALLGAMITFIAIRIAWRRTMAEIDKVLAQGEKALRAAAEAET